MALIGVLLGMRGWGSYRALNPGPVEMACREDP